MKKMGWMALGALVIAAALYTRGGRATRPDEFFPAPSATPEPIPPDGPEDLGSSAPLPAEIPMPTAPPAEVVRSAGPGGCSTPEECEGYCADARHVAECKPFSKQSLGQMREVLRSASPAVWSCLEKNLSAENLAQLKAGRSALDPQAGALAEQCFPAAADQIPENLRGPGGCTSAQACLQYCKDPAHWGECPPPASP